MTNIEQLKEHVQRLLALLEKPEPGVWAWHRAIEKRCDEIAEYAPSAIMVHADDIFAQTDK